MTPNFKNRTMFCDYNSCQRPVEKQDYPPTTMGGKYCRRCRQALNNRARLDNEQRHVPSRTMKRQTIPETERERRECEARAELVFRKYIRG